MSEYKLAVCGQRWILAYLFLFGFCFAYSLRVNMSVALVCMVKTPMTHISNSSNRTIISSQDVCGELEEESRKLNERAEFDWNTDEQSAVLSSFFYGYIVTQIPGGWLADRFGGRRVFGFAMAISAVCTILLPLFARTTVYLVYISRVILGLVSGVFSPACYSMLGRWAPRLERSKLAAISKVGSVIGTIATFAASGFLCEYGFDNGWSSIFYITGGLSLIWVVIWFYQVRDSPTLHPRITDRERDYIVDNIEFDTSKKSYTVPWKDMAVSVPLWAIIICHISDNWTLYTLMTSLPAFMKGVLKFDIKSNGALSSIPYLCAAMMAMVSSHAADFLRSKHLLTTTQTRKLFQTLAFIGGAVFLVATGFVPCNLRALAVVFLCLAVMSASFINGGYAVNHIDLAPKYAGILYGITNTMATLPGIAAPIIAGELTPNDTSSEWRNVFYIGAGFYIFGTIFFLFFGSGEIQPWARDKDIEIKVNDELQVVTKPMNGQESPESSLL